VAVPVPPHVAVAVVPDSVHSTGAFALLKMGRIIVPVGAVGPLVDVSVTVAVHVTSWVGICIISIVLRCNCCSALRRSGESSRAEARSGAEQS